MKKMDEKVWDQPGQKSSFFTCFKRLSFRTPILTEQSNLLPLSFPKGQLCHHFPITQIRLATKNFSKSLLIGKGGFGNMYKGRLKNGKITTVSVKRRNLNSFQGDLEFLAELEVLSMLQHANIIRLIGYCNDDTERIIIYEYMSNGNLGDHLHMHGTPLSWLQRLKICIDVACGLDYLHSWTNKEGIIHRDVKSSNILLNHKWAAKITDFGLSMTIPMDVPDVSDGVFGTIGYLDPEYMITGLVSTKSDVYSFGVVLLEVLCRRRPMDRIHDEEQWRFVVWAQDSLRNGKLEEIIDPDLKGQISLKCLNDYARIVDCCLRERQEQRATMAEVVVGLKSILALEEREDYSTNPMGTSISDRRVQNYFFSSRMNSAQAPSGSSAIPSPGQISKYSLKGIKLISVESHQPKGDDSQMSDSISEIDVISEQSYNLEECLSPIISPNHEFVDEQIVSRNQKQSLHDMMQFDYIQRVDTLTSIKDFLHLIFFYPMKKEAEINFPSLIRKFSFLNNYIKISQDFLMHENYLFEIQTLLQDVEELLDDAAFDMVAYLPETNSDELPRFWSGIPEIHASVTDSVRDRALRCINDLKVNKLGISGSGAEKVAETLKDLTELTSVFDTVLFVCAENRNIEEIMSEIQIEMQKNIHNQFLNCLLFVDCSDEFIDLLEPELYLSTWFETVQIVMTSGRGQQNSCYKVDLEIRIQDHFLPWILFSSIVDLETIVNYSKIQQMASHLVQECHGHLLAIVLLAKALSDVVDISIWELALHELASQNEASSSQLTVTNDVTIDITNDVTSDVMVRVLRFIWSRVETVSQRCIVRFALHDTGTEIKIPEVIYGWFRDGFVKSEQEGEYVFKDLIRSFLLEQAGESFVRMRNEVRVILISHFLPRSHGLYLKKDGSKSNETPNVEEWDAREIHLNNNLLSELPDSPNCPILVNLFLHLNHDLMDIPTAFFDNMPTLHVLDLSGTSIQFLPSSISKLKVLRKLFVRNCDLMMELPQEIGALKNLKVFDCEGTQLIRLPMEFGSLTKLECLKFSLYNFADTYKRNNQTTQIIPANLSKLVRLKELSIYVDSYSQWWEDEVKLIINICSKLRNLEYLRLYFPTTELLGIFMETQNWQGVPIYQNLSNFGFVVGHLQQRVISRLPLDLHDTFVKLPKCLKYTKGEGDTEVISTALKHANALFLDRHWTIQCLSSFKLEEIENLKFCVLSECNEMVEIVNVKDLSLKPVFESLEYLSVHYMKSFGCIWNGPIHSKSLSKLKTLVMHACLGLKNILTHVLIDNLTCLEYLIVEDCPNIVSIVNLGSNGSRSTRFLPRLKKMSLLHLPELVSISDGVTIAPKLDSLVVYDCVKLEKLSCVEVCDQIREIKGENEWWDALKWSEPEWSGGRPVFLDRVFIAIGTDDDIMDELADAVNFLPHIDLSLS